METFSKSKIIFMRVTVSDDWAGSRVRKLPPAQTTVHRGALNWELFNFSKKSATHVSWRQFPNPNTLESYFTGLKNKHRCNKERGLLGPWAHQIRSKIVSTPLEALLKMIFNTPLFLFWQEHRNNVPVGKTKVWDQSQLDHLKKIKHVRKVSNNTKHHAWTD